MGKKALLFFMLMTFCLKGYRAFLPCCPLMIDGILYPDDASKAFYLAVKDNNLDLAKKINNQTRFEGRPMIDLRLGEEGNSPLMEAVKNGNLKMVEYLIEIGADTNLKNSKKENALRLAKKEKQTEIEKYLKRYS